jgi:GNAT superfamily N-acetyltransferase
MTPSEARTTRIPIQVRFAQRADAGAISQLYIRTYTPSDGSSARDHYPFPQIMDEEKVAALIDGGTVVWVVAELKGVVIGSAAALRNMGGPRDRIAEIFGVAVDKTCRRKGVASVLLQKLRTGLVDVADFILCEARTAEAGAWKAAQNTDLQPVGFEPYAHSMPIGFESMTLAAWWRVAPGTQLSGLDPAENTKACVKFADAVFATANRPMSEQREPACAEVPAPSISARRDDQGGQAWYASADAVNTQTAIVELFPFKGVEPRPERFDHAWYVASVGEREVAAARVLYDHTDARARILGLRATLPGIEAQFVESIVADLLRAANNGPLVIVVCVRAGALAAQIGLEAAEFFPTAYFPNMISTAAGRAGVIQYTRLFHRSWRDSIRFVTSIEWPEAKRLIDLVLDETALE